MEIDVNYLAVGVGAVVSFVFGAMWYGPLFSKTWVRLSGFTPEQVEEGRKQSMAKSYVLTFVGCLLISSMLWHIIVLAEGFSGESGLTIGVLAGFWSWLGFVVPITLGSVLWEGRSWSLWLFNNAYHLLNFAIIGATLSCF